MASSDTAQISTIVDLIQIINPKSILDVGCGYGKYGFLSKEYLMGDTWDNTRTIVNAVEGYEKNITEMQRRIYNDIFICDAMDFNNYLKQDYDLICMIDAFEHLSVEDGRKFVDEALKRCNHLLISVPRYVDIQKGYTDDPNKFEEHRAFWTRSMFKSLGNCIIIPNNARKTIALFSKSGDFSVAIKKFCSKKLYLKFLPYIAADTVNHIKWFLKRNNKDAYLEKSKLKS
jgi:SAM-dependent methyltransferase